MTDSNPPKNEALEEALRLDRKETGYLMYRLDILAYQFQGLMRKNPHTFDFLAEQAIAANKPTLQNCYWEIRSAADYLIEQIPEEDLEEEDKKSCGSNEVRRDEVFFEP